MEHFINYLETGRTENLKECMNLYEEEKSRSTLISEMNEQLIDLEKQNDSLLEQQREFAENHQRQFRELERDNDRLRYTLEDAESSLLRGMEELKNQNYDLEAKLKRGSS